MWVSGGKKCLFFGKFYVCTLWMVPNSFFIYAFQSKYFANFQKVKKVCARKPILANIGTRVFKNFSPVQKIVVPPRETNINKFKK